MGFLGVYSAIYDYHPQAQGELELREGDLLYILEKSDEDAWWKAKKKAERDDEDEPEGLVPNNYVEEVRITLLGDSLCCFGRTGNGWVAGPPGANPGEAVVAVLTQG